MLNRLMMQMYKEAVEEEETKAIHVEVEAGWELLLRKDGDTKRYRDAPLKNVQTYLVQEMIFDFSRQNGVCEQALAGHVSGFLHKRLYRDDGLDPYYFKEDEQLEDKEDGEGENDDDNEEDDSRDEDGVSVDATSVDDE